LTPPSFSDILLSAYPRNTPPISQYPMALINPTRCKVLKGAALVSGAAFLSHFSRLADGSPMVAIPNYTRLNRGGRSIVWLREA
jgi:hypothetical protein